MLRARVFDVELRRIVKDLQEAATGAILTSDPDKVWERMQAAGDLTTQMHERVNVLLKELF
jgi:putative heme iron utilization protein